MLLFVDRNNTGIANKFNIIKPPNTILFSITLSIFIIDKKWRQPKIENKKDDNIAKNKERKIFKKRKFRKKFYKKKTK